ncbi:hypothetical protein BJ508DRAFT_307900 [Ascobolus immersus RN42]|uniref:Uncharacterized protein n=1 Tax=Ascobolus immersus RN42 TaxID=1160509 RepID=A0A3N4I7C6_ASCIM|nr:hypothetical protein BJ508DRAFT_307900 [Ascobolus immersus RN42]
MAHTQLPSAAPHPRRNLLVIGRPRPSRKTSGGIRKVLSEPIKHSFKTKQASNAPGSAPLTRFEVILQQLQRDVPKVKEIDIEPEIDGLRWNDTMNSIQRQSLREAYRDKIQEVLARARKVLIHEVGASIATPKFANVGLSVPKSLADCDAIIQTLANQRKADRLRWKQGGKEGSYPEGSPEKARNELYWNFQLALRKYEFGKKWFVRAGVEEPCNLREADALARTLKDLAQWRRYKSNGTG